MALTAKENFRFGFLLRCAEEGLTPNEIQERVKLAHHLKEADALTASAIGAPALGKGLAGLANAWASLPINAALLTIGGGGLLGAGAGYGLAKMQNDDVNPEEAKRQELIAAYKLHAEKARRSAARRRYRNRAPKEPALFTG